MSEIHSFCQNSRKAIEIANLIDNKIRPYAYSIVMSRAGESIIVDGIEETIKITDQNFMWISGRIIHSVCVMVCSENNRLETTQRRLYSEERNKYFSFGSDNDGASASPGSYAVSTKQTHYIDIEDFLACYADELTIKIEDAIKALRPL